MPRASGAVDQPTGRPSTDRPPEDRQSNDRQTKDRQTNDRQSNNRQTKDRQTTDRPPKDRPERDLVNDLATNDVPEVRVSVRGASRLQTGHVWVYRSDVETNTEIAAGAFVRVADHRGKPLGAAFYSSSSQIAIRMLTSGALAKSKLPELVRQRIRQAVNHRKLVVRDTDAYRVVFSEADFLPGLIVDCYNGLLSVQFLTQAMDSAAVRETVLATLREQLQPRAIIERVEARVRELEQLPPRESQLLDGTETSTIFTMNGIRFHFDGLHGQKTGAFLDQRENYAAAAEYGHGDALDVFCYQGGFALHLAPKCQKITGVDSSLPALKVAEENAQLNHREVEWMEANAFDLLKDYASAGRQYDTIVLDPPAFAKTKRDLPAAARGYKELNLRALRMLRPGGILVTCSCSYHVSERELEEIVVAASLDARRTVRLLATRVQAKDHPIVPTIAETAYLKALILQVV
jgi:23S rRNA (cytosine1962-C5)-methyltransferase